MTLFGIFTNGSVLVALFKREADAKHYISLIQLDSGPHLITMAEVDAYDAMKMFTR